MTDLTYFERRHIQMEFAVPLIKDLQAILGEELVNSALQQRNKQKLAATQSEKPPNFERMDKDVEAFAAGDALGYEILASDSASFDMNVTRCRYAEMMDELGGRDFGHLLICAGDFAEAKRVGMTLTRSQTRMQGADYCDFRYRAAQTN